MKGKKWWLGLLSTAVVLMSPAVMQAASRVPTIVPEFIPRDYIDRIYAAREPDPSVSSTCPDPANTINKT